MSEETKVWGIHTKNDSLFINKKVIAIGWNDMGDMSKIAPNRDAFKDVYSKTYPNDSKNSVANCVGQLLKFVVDMKIGDYVIYPCKLDREIYIGQIEGNYEYIENDGDYKNQRHVKWLKHLPRSTFSQGALYEVGAFTTVFQIKNYVEDFMQALDKNFKPKEIIDVEDETVEATADMVVQNTKDYVLRELKHHYKGYDLEDVVEQLLKAMGYKTYHSPKGGDNGKDIIAYKDELPPRIMVQVKSQDSDITEALLQSLKGAMTEGDYGLFVALSNYTKNAQKYLDMHPIIKGINGEEFVELILKYYDLMDDSFKVNIKLQRVYLPVK